MQKSIESFPKMCYNRAALRHDREGLNVKQRNICRKNVRILATFVLIMIICILSSCEGYSVGKVRYSAEELEKDLVSVELIYREYVELDCTDTLVGVATQEQQHVLMERLSEITFQDWRGPTHDSSSYVLKLTYVDKFMVLSPYSICVYDVDGNYMREESYLQNFSEELNTLLEEYAGILKARI